MFTYVILAAFALLVALLWLHAYLTEPWRVTGRNLRRGGYMLIEPNASAESKAGTAERVGTYTGCSTGGVSLVARARLGMPREPNRTTVPGDFTCGQHVSSETATQPGTHTTDAKP